jgi:hypothetical protein
MLLILLVLWVREISSDFSDTIKSGGLAVLLVRLISDELFVEKIFFENSGISPL